MGRDTCLRILAVSQPDAHTRHVLPGANSAPLRHIVPSHPCQAPAVKIGAETRSGHTLIVLQTSQLLLSSVRAASAGRAEGRRALPHQHPLHCALRHHGRVAGHLRLPAHPLCPLEQSRPRLAVHRGVVWRRRLCAHALLRAVDAHLRQGTAAGDSSFHDLTK